MKKEVIVLFILLLFSLAIPSVTNAAIGISPGDQIYLNFQPGLEKDFSFKAFGVTETTKIKIFSEGELNSSTTFDVSEINQTSSTHIFNAHIRLPEKIEKPGEHIIYISVQSVSSLQGTIATSEKAQIPVHIFVPFPGKYIEATFNINDVNLGENLQFSLNIINRGTQALNEVYTVIDIFESSGNKLKTLETTKIPLQKEQEQKFNLILNSSELRGQGPYKSVATIFFDGETKNLEEEFRVGVLNVNILNHTQIFEKDKINIFDVVIESVWNSKINNVFAKVRIENTEFQTPSVELSPWERKTIRGFFDTTNFEEGIYTANITLFYEKITTTKISQIEIVKKLKFDFNLTTILILIIVIIIIIDILWLLVKKKKKNNEKD
ncbi:MAG: hypothetical protein HYS32_03230 [Candidatus Woesearchaeota archaeon]|nr:MAG: hypothetical protein HYS32_03230 [Candidatus Woesearchaeota archaeon]